MPLKADRLTPLALVRAAKNGQRVWLRAAGKSMWPLLLSADSLRVQRCEASDLAQGDIALVVLGQNMIAHLVVATNPVRTASIVGVVDADCDEVLGRIVEVRRGRFRVKVPRLARHVMRLMPALAPVARRLPGARALVRFLRR